MLEGRRDEWIGILERRGRGGVVTPWRETATWQIAIGPRELHGARDGDVVVVAPLRRVRRAREPRGRGRRAPRREQRRGPDRRGAGSARLARGRLPGAGVAAAPAGRVPGRRAGAGRAARAGPARAGSAPAASICASSPFLTIDPANARDHDDAVCVEPLAGGRLAAVGRDRGRRRTTSRRARRSTARRCAAATASTSPIARSRCSPRRSRAISARCGPGSTGSCWWPSSRSSQRVTRACGAWRRA